MNTVTFVNILCIWIALIALHFRIRHLNGKLNAPKGAPDTVGTDRS